MSGSSCHSPCRAPYWRTRPGPHHRTVRVDDPASRCAGPAVVGVGVGEHLVSGRSDRLARRRTPGSARPGDHRQASRTAPPAETTSTSPSKPSPANRVEVDTGRALHHRDPAAVDLERARPTAAGRRAGRTDAARRLRRAGSSTTTVSRLTGCSASARHSGTSAPRLCRGHRQPDLVDIAAQHEGRRLAQGGQFGADRTGRVVDTRPASRWARCRATTAVVACCSASSVNNQPTPRSPANFAAALRRSSVVSHQRGGVLAEPVADRGDVGDQAGVGEPQPGHLGERGRPGVAASGRRRRRGVNVRRV